MFIMEPNDLKVKELDYELKIRKISPEGDVQNKRKLLRGALSQESANRSTLQVAIVSPIPYDDDVAEIMETMADLKGVIEEFSGSKSDSAFRRINSRLTHLSGRIQRLVDDDTNQAKVKGDLQMELLVLEGDFAFKLVPIASTPQTSSAPHTFDTSSSSCPKSVSPYKWNLHFTGENKKESVHSFLEKVEMLSAARGVSKAELFTSAYDLFKGSALTWYHSIKFSLNSWDDLVQRLKKDFLPYFYDDDLQREIDSRTQGVNEKVTLYIACMIGLFNRLSKKPDEEVIVNKIRRNLSPYFVSQLALHQINSVDQLSQLCRQLEESRMWTERYRPPPSNTSQLLEPDLNYSLSLPGRNSRTSFTSSFVSESSFRRNVSTVNASSMRCWNCDSFGHSFSNCRKPKSIFCFSCGAKRVTKANCGKCRSKYSKNEGTGNRVLDDVPSSSNQRPDQSLHKDKGKGKGKTSNTQ